MEEKDFSYRTKWILANPEDIRPAFDDIPEFSAKYLEESRMGPGTVVRGGALFLGDFSSPYANCANGMRHTHGNPDQPLNTIHMLGPSYLYSIYAYDQHTISSFLQQCCNEYLPEKGYAIKNYGTRSSTILRYTLQILALPIRKGDIVLVVSHLRRLGIPADDVWKHIKVQQKLCREKGARYCFFLHPRLRDAVNPSYYERYRISNSYESLHNQQAVALDGNTPSRYVQPDTIKDLNAAGCPAFDLQPYFNRPHDHGELFIDKSHLAPKGNAIAARAIYDCFIARQGRKGMKTEKSITASFTQLARILRSKYQSNQSIRSWLDTVAKGGFDPALDIGAIIMNCNPFTNGHRYLIAKALEMAGHLYVFVVEENLSDFSFTDRLDLVHRGTVEFGDRVKVLPGGSFIISSFTFPEYFDKTQLTTEKVDSSNDIAIFGAIIAPSLGISHRFVGEEPYCNVTSQYNQTMRSILPYMGVTVHEIPRVAHDGRAISASLVRACLKDGNFGLLRDLVPPSTLAYLMENRK